jgi:hypothetical protein
MEKNKKLSDKLKEYFENTPESKIKEDWESTKKYDDYISPLILDNRVDITPLIDFIKTRVKVNTYYTSNGEYTIPLNHINIDVATIIRLLNIQLNDE